MPAHDALATDVVIVGAGVCGNLVANEMTAAGFRTTVIEAGPRFRPADLPNSEANGGKIIWTEPRVYAGKHSVAPKTGVGLGGGMLAWLGVVPRFHPADFRTYSTEGVGSDWPIGYDDLRSDYAAVERELGVAGECGPFAPEAYELPMPPHRMNWAAQLLARGASALGLPALRRPSGVLLLRLVCFGLRQRRQGDRARSLARTRGATRRAGHRGHVRATSEF
jgi:choline dehydrogenase-like flavoprotein